jgi:hypothetical protein
MSRRLRFFELLGLQVQEPSTPFYPPHLARITNTPLPLLQELQKRGDMERVYSFLLKEPESYYGKDNDLRILYKME